MDRVACLHRRVLLNRAGQQGFSLLEALVAMSIASLAVGALYKVAGQMASSAGSLSERAQAALLARSVLAEGMFAEDLLKKAQGAEGGMEWTANVTPVSVIMADSYSAKSLGQLQVARINVHIKVGQHIFDFEGVKPYRQASFVK